jgi:hypothetical protein
LFFHPATPEKSPIYKGFPMEKYALVYFDKKLGGG